MEEHDEVKHMNQQMIYAKCVTIRETQLEEKQRIQRELQEEEERIDLMMEINRLKTIKKLADDVTLKQEQRLVGAEVIKKQIKEREQIRLKQINLLEEDEKREIEQKHEKQTRMMEEVQKSN